MNTIFENSGGTYTQKNGYLYPNITIPEEDKTTIGKYGRLRKRCIEEHRPIIYNQLFISGKLFSISGRLTDAAVNGRNGSLRKWRKKKAYARS